MLTFFLGLLILIQLSSLYLVDFANTRNARVLVGDALHASSQLFKQQITSRNEYLIQAGQLLSADFAFKTAVASGKVTTINSALQNQRRRIGADLMMLLSMDGKLTSISGGDTELESSGDDKPPFPDLIEKARAESKTSGIVVLNEHLYSIIIVPLMTPVPSAWIVLGFEIDEPSIKMLQEESHAEVSIIAEDAGEWRLYVSTLDKQHRNALRYKVNIDGIPEDSAFETSLATDEYISLLSRLPTQAETPLYVILQRPREEAMAPYNRLRMLLVVLFLFGLLITFVGGLAIVNSVTRPLRLLTESTKDILHGKYNHEVSIEQRDEIGQLAGAFNEMSRGLHERDRVRDLLGKVMSPHVADELLTSDVQLGGEEREVTILFTDLRNFTQISETHTPSQMLEILNDYLTRMTAVIDRYEGIVDKYIGDSIMALFGAPLKRQDHAERAVACALDMLDALDEFNADAGKRGWPQLAMGIGINTSVVVLANIGSKDRLNYTAIGDGVNLAARLEAVTKDYGAPIIVSEVLKNRASGFEYRYLDRIRIRGKEAKVSIYTPERRKNGETE